MTKQNLEEELPGIKKNVSLKDYTTFRIGGPARYFYEAKTKKDLIKAVQAAKKLKSLFFILGGGSNLLVSDKGFNGLVINFNFQFSITQAKRRVGDEGKPRRGQTSSTSNFKIFKIIAGAGLSLNDLMKNSVAKNLTGLEWAVGIPGTIGGAIYGNAGAFGKSMADAVKSVEALDVKTLKIKKLKNNACQFGYRESIFKKKKNLIIFSAELELEKNGKKEIEKRIKEYLKYKKETQPLNLSSAGSVFKNSGKFSAGELIEKCGLKGKKIGQAQISQKHANFIVNLGGTKSQDLKKLINLAKKEVKKKFGIILKEEIQYLGFEN